jgi:hypothetical protein
LVIVKCPVFNQLFILATTTLEGNGKETAIKYEAINMTSNRRQASLKTISILVLRSRFFDVGETIKHAADSLSIPNIQGAYS